jgi:outer membrane protein
VRVAGLALGAALFLAAGCALRGEGHAREVAAEALAAPPPRIDPRELLPLVASGVSGPPAPLALRDALALAVETSEAIRAAGEEIHEAYLLRVQAAAGLLPAAKFHWTYFRQEDQIDAGGSTPGGGAARISPPETRTARFGLTQPLVNVGSWLALAQAASVIDVAEARLRAARLFVEQTTAAIFYQALDAEKRVETFRAALERDEQRLREVRGRAAAGLARRTEVLFVETDRARTAASLAESQERLAAARERLEFLVGRKILGPLVESAAPPAASPDALLARPLEEHIERAIALRPDLRALREEVSVEDGALRVAIGGYIPTLEASANYYVHREGFLGEVDWDVTVDLVAPIFEGLLTTARVRDAESRKRRAALLYRDEARAIARDVAASWRDLRAVAAARSARSDALRAAEENFRLLEAEYRTGLATNLELVAAQQELTEARLAFETQRLDERRLAIELAFLTGGIED